MAHLSPRLNIVNIDISLTAKGYVSFAHLVEERSRPPRAAQDTSARELPPIHWQRQTQGMGRR